MNLTRMRPRAVPRVDLTTVGGCDQSRAVSYSVGIAAALAFAFTAQMTVSLLLMVVPVLAPEIAKGRGLDVHLIAFYFPIIYTVAFVSSLLAPMLLPRFGGAGYSILCVACGAAGLLLLLPPSLPLTLAATVMLGVANGGATPATSQVVAPYCTPRTAGLIMSVRQSAIPAGGMLAGLVLPIAASFSGWHAVIVVGFACTALALLLLPALRLLNDTRSARPTAQRRPWQPLKRLLAMPGMPQMLLAVFTSQMLVMCVRAFFTVYIVNDLGFGLGVGGLALAAAQLARIPGALACAVVADRWLSPRAVLAVNLALMTAAALLAAGFTHDWPIAAILGVAVLLGFFACGSSPVMLGEIARRAPSHQVGILVSGGNLAIMAGSSVGPLVFGATASVFGYPVGFVAIALFTLAGAIAVAPPPVARPTADGPFLTFGRKRAAMNRERSRIPTGICGRTDDVDAILRRLEVAKICPEFLLDRV